MPTDKILKCPSAVLWDLDGTLIDQTIPIIKCYTHTFTSLGYPTPDSNIIKRSLGGPLASTMEVFIEDKDMEEACKIFRNKFPKIMFDGMVVLSGAIKCIKSAYNAKIPQAIITNKDGNTAREVSKFAGFSKYIPICIGSSDTRWNKPDRRLTEHVIKLLKVSYTNIIVIGDSPTDVNVAQNAGLVAYCVTTGAHCEAELKDAGAAATFKNLSNLYQIFSYP